MDALNIKRLDHTPEHPYVRFFLDVRVRVGGKPRRMRETLRGGSWQQARTRYFELQTMLRSGKREAAATPGTFGDVLERYRNSRGEIPRSQRPTFETLVRDLGPVDLRVLESALESYGTLIRKTVSPKSGKRYSSATVNRLRSMATAALNLAVDLRILEKNPLTRAVWPKLREAPRDRILSPLEIQNLLNVIDREAPHLGPLVRFSLAMPARKAELVGARREWLDLVNGVIRIPGKAAKGGRGSTKPISPDLWNYFATLPADCPWLFYRKVGDEYHPLGDFKRSWGRCLKLAGIPDFRFHDLRHVSCTQLLAAGSTLKAVQDVGGWTSSKMVDRYHSFLGQNLRDSIKFPTGKESTWVHPGYASKDEAEKGGEIEAERAVS